MFTRSILAFGLTAAMLSSPVLAQNTTALVQSPPPAPYAKVSDLVALPEFLPGLGTLYVDPATLPAGPFLGYDRDGKLAATVYMTPGRGSPGRHRLRRSVGWLAGCQLGRYLLQRGPSGGGETTCPCLVVPRR